MRIEPIIAIQLLVFLGPAWGFYRISMSRICHGGGSPWLASLIFASWLVVAPYGLLYLFRPLINWVFMTYPALQDGAWDVGLALALWAGMILSYLVGIVLGLLGITKFFWANPSKENEHAC